MVFNADDLNLMLKSHEETLTACLWRYPKSHAEKGISLLRDDLVGEQFNLVFLV
jgi:hypothetical protein